MDFNDLEHLCLEILIDKDEEGNIKPSQVALEFKDKFEEVLVDEYQDSNTIQETIVGMVSRRDVENPNVFMVGDVKQSIYKFRFEEVLVDEYQDSNTIQETIVGMVSRRDVENPNVFMVGDVKQSIYKFRQANPDLFLEKYINYREFEDSNRKL